MRRGRTVLALAPADMQTAVRSEAHIEADPLSGRRHGVQEFSAAIDVRTHAPNNTIVLRHIPGEEP
jgi:hypothetical protein